MSYYFLFFAVFGVMTIAFMMTEKSNKDNTRGKNKTYLIFSGVYFVLLMGLRAEYVGTDTSMYGNIFSIFGQTPMLSEVAVSLSGQFLYRLFSKAIFIIFDGSYQWMLVFSAIIVILGVFRFIYYTSENFYLSVFLFILLWFFFESWNASRQYLALAIGLNSVVEFNRSNKKVAVILFVLAVLMHNTAAVLFIYFLIYRIKWTKAKMIIFFAACFVGTLFYSHFVVLFANYSPRYAALYSSYVAESLITMEAQGRKMLISISYLMILLAALLFLDKKELDKGMISLWLLSAIVIIEIVIGIVMPNDVLALRVQTYFSIFVISVIPNVMKEMKLSSYSIIPVAIYFVPFYINLSENRSGILPYISFWTTY